MSTPETSKLVLITPEQARDMLRGLGIRDEDWQEIVNSGLHNHTNRALIHIASGSEPKDVDQVFDELFPDDEHGPRRKEVLNEQLNYIEYPKLVE